jgi:hypothetical protein
MERREIEQKKKVCMSKGKKEEKGKKGTRCFS